MRFVPALLVALVALARPTAVFAEAAVSPIARVLADVMSNPECAAPASPLVTDIEFAPGSARVYSTDRERLAAFARWWRAHGASTTIAVEGTSGARARSEAANLALSQRRADRVRRYLVRYGVDADRVLAVGEGSHGPGRRVALSVVGCAAD